MRLQGAADLSCSPTHERHDRTSVARRTHRNREPPIGAHEHQDLTLAGTTKLNIKSII